MVGWLTLIQQILVRVQAGQCSLKNGKVAARGRQSVLKTDVPGESLWVRLLCLPELEKSELESWQRGNATDR